MIATWVAECSRCGVTTWNVEQNRDDYADSHGHQQGHAVKRLYAEYGELVG